MNQETLSFDPDDKRALAPLWEWLAELQIDAEKLTAIQEKTSRALDLKVDKRLSDWRTVYRDLPSFTASDQLHLSDPELSLSGEWSDVDHALETLQRLHPWRKGPLRLGDLFIDTEWRSDWKWSRALPHLGDLKGMRVLDIGCGNGYHCWRALGEGAEAVLGVDPTRLFHYQHRVLASLFNAHLFNAHLLPTPSHSEDKRAPLYPIHHLPLTLEDLDHTPLPLFDWVFSMGVLYHRREPQEHLRSLQRHFKPSGGKLLIETLVTPDPSPLYPSGRYAQMRNVWCLPDVSTLLAWLESAGYRDARLVDLNQTSLQEQRQTEWMRFHSLTQALDPENLDLTIEGHPAPLRAMVVAEFA